MSSIFSHPSGTTQTPSTVDNQEKIIGLEFGFLIATRIPTLRHISYRPIGTRINPVLSADKINEGGRVKGTCRRVMRDEGDVLIVEELHGPNKAAEFERMKTIPL